MIKNPKDKKKWFDKNKPKRAGYNWLSKEKLDLEKKLISELIKNRQEKAANDEM